MELYLRGTGVFFIIGILALNLVAGVVYRPRPLILL